MDYVVGFNADKGLIGSKNYCNVWNQANYTCRCQKHRRFIYKSKENTPLSKQYINIFCCLL